MSLLVTFAQSSRSRSQIREERSTEATIYTILSRSFGVKEKTYVGQLI